MTSQEDEDGLSSIELAVTFSAVLVLLTTLFHFGLLFLAGAVADDMADSALQVAERNNGSPTLAAEVAADVAAQQGFVKDHTIAVERAGREVTVQITVHSRALLPVFPSTLVRTVSGPVETFIAERDR